MATLLHADSATPDALQKPTSTGKKRGATPDTEFRPRKRTIRSQTSAHTTPISTVQHEDQLSETEGREASPMFHGDAERIKERRTRSSMRSTSVSRLGASCCRRSMLLESDEMVASITRELVEASRKAWSALSTPLSSLHAAHPGTNEDYTCSGAQPWERWVDSIVYAGLTSTSITREDIDMAQSGGCGLLEMEDTECAAFMAKWQMFLVQVRPLVSDDTVRHSAEVPYRNKEELRAEVCMFEAAWVALERKWLLRRIGVMERMKKFCSAYHKGSSATGLEGRRRSSRLLQPSPLGTSVNIHELEEVQRWQYGQLESMDARIGAWLGLRQALLSKCRTRIMRARKEVRRTVWNLIL